MEVLKLKFCWLGPFPSLAKYILWFCKKRKRMQIGQNTGMIVEPTTMYVNNPNHPKDYQGEGGNQNVINTVWIVLYFLSNKIYKSVFI